jgi:hypothetical protein
MLAAGLIGLTLPQPYAQTLSAHGPATSVASAPSNHRATISTAAQGSASLVYVSDAVNNAVCVYNNVPNATPIRAITGFNNPRGIAVDSYGNLYVANGGANDVLVYAPGSGTPSRSYSQGLDLTRFGGHPDKPVEDRCRSVQWQGNRRKNQPQQKDNSIHKSSSLRLFA